MFNKQRHITYRSVSFMAKPVSSPKADSETRRQILRAALKHFANTRYAATSVQQIVGNAKVSKPALYYHFRDKAALFQALVSEAHDQQLQMPDDVHHQEWCPRHSPWLVAVGVMLATFMQVLATSNANIALPHTAGSLSATPDEATWVLRVIWRRMPSSCTISCAILAAAWR